MLDIVAARRTAEILAQQRGHSVRFHTQDNNRYYTEPDGTIHVPDPQIDWTKDELTFWRNGLCHEIGHHLPEVRDCFDMQKRKNLDMKSFLGVTVNFFEDVRNDTNRCRVFPGQRADKVSAVENIYLNTVLPQVRNEPELFSKEERNNMLLTVSLMSVRLMAFIDDTLESVVDSFRTSINPQATDWLDQFESDGWVERFMALPDADGVFDFSHDVLTEIFKLELPPKEDSQPKEGEGGGGKSGTESDGDGEEGSTSTKKGGFSTEEVTFKYEDLLNAHDDEYTDIAVGGSHSRIDYDSVDSYGTYKQHTPDTTYIGTPREIKAKIGRKLLGLAYDAGFKASHFEKVVNDSGVETLAGKAKKYLTTATMKRTQRDLRRGKLDTSKLHKLATHTSRKVRPAVFRQTSQNVEIDTAVSVLVDCSGSMYGGTPCKIMVAAAGAWGMHQMCNALKIPVEIAGFTEWSSLHNGHLLFKTFNRKVTKDQFLTVAAEAGNLMSENADGDNIAIAYSRLLQRPEPKKLLVVLSDGSPASERGDTYAYTRQIVESIQDDHRVDIMGVGIMDDNVRHIYAKNEVVYRLPELPGKLLDILKANVIK